MPGKVGNPGKRNGKRLVPERLRVIDQMLHQCYTHSAIVAVCSQQWGIGTRQVRNYIKRVYQQWDEDARKTLVDRVHLRRKQLEGVLEVAMQQEPPDLRAAVQALDRLCRIDNAFAPEQVNNIISHADDIHRMTSDEQRKEIASLVEKYKAMTAAGTSNGSANGSGLTH